MVAWLLAVVGTGPNFVKPRSSGRALAQLKQWLRSYRPAELFDDGGTLRVELAARAPDGDRRMGAILHANGGLLTRDLDLPDVADYAVAVPAPVRSTSEATRVLGRYLRDVLVLNAAHANFRVFGPDETASYRLTAVLEATDRTWEAERRDGDDHLAPDGRVMEVLSEHLCEGWLEGYLLTGRHGLFNCYEAFIHIVDSMVNQHAKWLKVSAEVPWRRPVPSLNILLSSHVCTSGARTTTGSPTRIPASSTTSSTRRRRSRAPTYRRTPTACSASPTTACAAATTSSWRASSRALNLLSPAEAVDHCTRGLGTWPWASGDAGGPPDVVMACAGDAPTLEALAAPALLGERLPELRVRFVNVVDLMRLQPTSEHPHGLSEADFDALFTVDRPVIFAFHGYPTLIHRLTYRRENHRQTHVRGYKEEGTTTTPLDMLMLNDLDRFHLVMDAIDRVPGLRASAAALRQEMVDERLRHRAHTRQTGEDPPEIRNWTWPAAEAAR